MSDWLSTKQAAELLEVSRRTVVRSFETDASADEKWGKANWRRRPHVGRTEYQIRRTRIEELIQESTDGTD